jgi:hypothetical protein
MKPPKLKGGFLLKRVALSDSVSALRNHENILLSTSAAHA